MKNVQLINRINAVQQSWAAGIVHIGKAAHQGQDREEVVSRATAMLDALYDFSNEHILFKPTKAAKVPFRFNFKDTLSYFIGGTISEDQGFALTPWKNVQFAKITESNIVQQDCDTLVMGEYTFTNYKGESATVQYTFGYRGDDLRIFLHHSSLPFEASNLSLIHI